jgi:hypothetical protein
MAEPFLQTPTHKKKKFINEIKDLDRSSKGKPSSWHGPCIEMHKGNGPMAAQTPSLPRHRTTASIPCGLRSSSEGWAPFLFGPSVFFFTFNCL